MTIGITCYHEGDLLHDVKTVIRQDATQTVHRNPFLSKAMVELNRIDTQGGGVSVCSRAIADRRRIRYLTRTP
jgi:predicted HTH transcriptional regulator